MRLQVGSLIAALLCVAVTESTAGAQTPGNAPAPCAAAEHRQFDFWIGEWDVTNPAGAVAGKNRITRILNECVLLEEWTGAGGGSGKAFDGTYRKVQKRMAIYALEGGESAAARVLRSWWHCNRYWGRNHHRP